jgi:uncharacterized membrane protein
MDLICPHCGFKDTSDSMHCEKCKAQIRRRKKFPIFLLFFLFILFLVLFPIIGNISIYIDTKRDADVDIPTEIVREVTLSVPEDRVVCADRNFRYSTLGGNVNNIGSYVRPNLQLNNLEEAGGEFKINFSYIDEGRFPNEAYGGKNLLQSIGSKKLNMTDADFYSETYTFHFEPLESKTIDNLTFNPTGNAYWAIADIVEPKLYECTNVSVYINKTMNKTFTEYKKIQKTITIKEYKSIREVFGITSFFNWFILLFLLLLIIILLLKIYERWRYDDDEFIERDSRQD